MVALLLLLFDALVALAVLGVLVVLVVLVVLPLGEDVDGYGEELVDVVDLGDED